MKSDMKVKSMPGQNSGSTQDTSLDRLEDIDLFPAKTAIAKATLLKAKLPSIEVKKAIPSSK